ncbi:phage tail protein [Klebsiella pneumoniae]|uniref:phage tail protein n=2 Tax=Enterobacterales TaxID=91347 RepID=UPI001CD94FC9|nr:phage tail protein [Klebsiella pneumoniae]
MLLINLGLGEGSPVIGSPFPWPHAKMPNELFPSMAGMVFLKSNGATFSSTLYPKLALAYPGLKLADLRAEFIRGWDDGRGVDSGRALLSSQEATGVAVTLGFFTSYSGIDIEDFEAGKVHPTYSVYTAQTTTSSTGTTYRKVRPRNVAFNFIVRAA